MFVYIDNNLYINICIISNYEECIAIDFEFSIFAISYCSSNSIFGTSDTNRVNKISKSFIGSHFSFGFRFLLLSIGLGNTNGVILWSKVNVIYFHF